MRDARAYARRATLRGSANALANARPSSITVRRAVDRMMARFEAAGDLSEDGHAVAAALRHEADLIVSEATDAHGRIAEHGLAELPVPVDHPLRVLTLGNAGVLAGGQFGTALGVVSAAAAAGRDIEIVVCETRPLLQGARLTAWELANAGIPFTLIADAAAATRLALGMVDVVLVAGDRLAANGDVAAVLGSYPLAALAARHGVPFVVCAPLVTFDPDSAAGVDLPLDERGAAELLWIGPTRIAPADARASNPVADVTPAELVSAIVTEEGVLRPPFGPALADAAAAGARRREGR
jgi:methylthioribose-1-phosphate isomerase